MLRTATMLMVGLIVWTTPLTAQEAGTPTAVIEALHAAMKAGDGQAVLALMAPDVVVFESGGAEMNRAEFVEHHLQPDMEFAASTMREVTSQQVGTAGEIAWVLTRLTTTGTFRERAVRRTGTETMVLRRTAQGWRIIHIHWSSRAMR